MFLSFSFSANALSAITASTIQGTNPYLELNGVKAVDLNSLVSITVGGVKYISDASGNMQKTNSDGSYSAVSSITLPNSGDQFDSVGTLVTPDNTVHALNSTDVIPLTSRKDDDGDSNFTVTGSIKGEWRDKDGNLIAPLTGSLSACFAPYTLTLTASGNPTIKTQYGDPKETIYGNKSAKFIINPAIQPTICFAKPDMTYSSSPYAGPATQWNTSKGFLIQSTTDYSKNFPTTGSNGLSFDLEVTNSTGTLVWPTVTVGGITASMTNIGTGVRVTLKGPIYGLAVVVPTLPAKIELVGTSTDGKLKAKYGFVIKKWFFTQGTYVQNTDFFKNMCSSKGYVQVSPNDLTNATFGSVSGSSPYNHYQRRIDGSLWGEWGKVNNSSADWPYTNLVYQTRTNSNILYNTRYEGELYYGNSTGLAYSACVAK